MRYLASILFISFIGITGFGFVGMYQGMNHQNGFCIASMVGGVVCPVSAIDFVLHHITALKTFSNALASSIFNFSLIQVFLLALIPIFLFSRKLFYPKLKLFIHWLQDFAFSVNYNREKAINWLALLEHSPSF